MNYPIRCELCNSPKIYACDECEHTISFACDRCDGMFEVEKSFHQRSLWWDSKRTCFKCEQNKATIDDGANSLCHECNFNLLKRAEREANR